MKLITVFAILTIISFVNGRDYSIFDFKTNSDTQSGECKKFEFSFGDCLRYDENKCVEYQYQNFIEAKNLIFYYNSISVFEYEFIQNIDDFVQMYSMDTYYDNKCTIGRNTIKAISLSTIEEIKVDEFDLFKTMNLREKYIEIIKSNRS